MFAQTFCDSPLNLSQKKWTTLISFSFETLAVVALILLPLFHVETLPPATNIATVFTPIIGDTAPAHPQSAAPSSAVLSFGVLDSNLLRRPSSIPTSTSNTSDASSEPPGVPWGTAQASDNSLKQIAGTGIHVGAVQQSPPDRPILVSQGVMEGTLIQKVVPIYPRAAMITRTEGMVILQAVISRSGNIENLQVISGSPFLSRAALDAVRQWRYRPYKLNGEPVEVETQIVVNFTLSDR